MFIGASPIILLPQPQRGTGVWQKLRGVPWHFRELLINFQLRIWVYKGVPGGWDWRGG